MTIKEIKSQLSIRTVLNHYSLHLNRNQMLKCPFHVDDKPSMKIYPETNTAYCFAGSCSIKSLDSIDFILQMDKSTKHEALKKAKTLIGNKSHLIKSPTMKNQFSSPDIELMTELFKYFEKGIKLPQTKNAQNYKSSRGLNGKVPIGYNAGRFHQNKSEEIVNRLLESGLLKPNATGYQPWANRCLIFPLKNKADEIVSMYGRSITEPGHYYLQNRKGLYPGYPNLKIKKLVLTESIVDAASLLQLDNLLENYTVLSLFGTNGLTTEHRQAILECIHLEEIIFALDGDEAGRKATETYSRQLKELYPEMKFTTLELPEGEDINSLHVNHQEESESLFMSLFENRKLVGAVPEKMKLEKIEIPKRKNGLITDNAELLRYENELLEIIILGGIKLEGLDRMKVTLKVNYENRTLRHSLDLYNDDQVEKFIKKICNRLDLGSREVQETLDKLTESLENYRLEQIETNTQNKPKFKQLSEREKGVAKKYLSAKSLMKKTMTDLGKSGIIGEELNRLLMYVVMTSRKRDHPLHIMSLAASGQGKTHLQERVADCMPEEDKMEITTLSDNALYYFGREELRHKLLLIEDLDGAEGVLYPLRELQSKRRITKTVTLKDAQGRMKTKSLEVIGPVCVAGCTTREGLYEDNANRSFLIYLDCTKEQDKRIMDYQRSLSAGKINRESEEKVRELLQNTQRLLQNVQVRNPFAELLQIPESVFKPRRSNAHYLAFVEAITFYHQYQRELKTDNKTGDRYIETALEDIEWANKLLAPVLLRKSDELTGACRTFLESLKSYLKQNKKRSFYSKELRRDLRINYSNLKRYLINLNQNGYVKVVGGTKSRGFEYEVVNLEEYQELKIEIKTVLNEMLKRVSGSVVQSGSK